MPRDPTPTNALIFKFTYSKLFVYIQVALLDLWLVEKLMNDELIRINYLTSFYSGAVKSVVLFVRKWF